MRPTTNHGSTVTRSRQGIDLQQPATTGDAIEVLVYLVAAGMALLGSDFAPHEDMTAGAVLLIAVLGLAANLLPQHF